MKRKLRRKILAAALASTSVGLLALSANALPLFRAAGGDWNTTTSNWGTSSGGPYNTAMWSNGNPDSATLETGNNQTLTLTTDITISGLNVNSGNNWKVTGGNTLTFPSGGIDVDRQNATIESGIAGSPDIQHTNIGGTNSGFLTLAPGAAVSMTIDRIDVQTNPANRRNSTLNLGGAGDGSANAIKWEDGRAQQLFVNKTGSGTWTVNDMTFYNRSGAGAGGEGRVTVTSGDLVVNGTIRASHDVFVNGGTLHYNNPAAVNSTGARSGGELTLNGGNLDNTSGAAINTSTHNPGLVLTGNGSTFIGTDNLNLGTGAATLTGNHTATINANTLTIGGAISHGVNPFGLTKAGPGTLELNGTNSYEGSTTVTGGTLSLGTASLFDGAPVTVDAGATLNLNFGGVDDIFQLTLGGSPVAAGIWGAIGSGAPNQSSLLTGTGRLNSAGGAAPPGTFYWDATVGGTGNGQSNGGNGTWSTANANWDTGFVARQGWTNDTANKAIFSAPKGVIALGEDITLGELVINTASTYEIGDSGETHTLNFGGAKLITVDKQSATFRAGIAGKPTVNSQGRADHNSTLALAPGAAVTMDIGALNLIRSDPARNTRLDLAGESHGNSIDALTWTNGGQQLTLTKKGSGTWAIQGDYDNNPNGDSRWVIDEGTLILNGNVNPSHQFDILDGGVLGGNGTVGVARGGASEVPRIMPGGAIAPGESIGTLTIDDSALIWNSDDVIAGMVFELSSFDNTSDMLNIMGAFTKGTGASFLFDISGGMPDQEYDLVKFFTTDFNPSDFAQLTTSTVEGEFAFVQLPAGGQALRFTTAPGAGIPEPATATLAMLGLGGLLMRRRRTA